MAMATARRWAWISAAAFVAAPVVLVAGVLFVPPTSSSTGCFGSAGSGPGDPGWTCETITSGSPIWSAVAAGGALLALLVSAVALVVCVVVLARRDARARSAWRAAGGEDSAPRTAALTLLLWGAAVLGLGLLGAVAASSLVEGLLVFPPFRLPEQAVDLYPLISEDSLRLSVALCVGFVALALQCWGVLLLMGAVLDAASAAQASRGSSDERVDAAV